MTDVCRIEAGITIPKGTFEFIHNISLCDFVSVFTRVVAEYEICSFKFVVIYYHFDFVVSFNGRNVLFKYPSYACFILLVVRVYLIAVEDGDGFSFFVIFVVYVFLLL